MNLEDHRLPGTNEVFYIPNFVTEDEELYLLRKITGSPQVKWKKLANRRLQLFGGELSAKNVLVSQEMPAFLTTYPNIIERIKSTGAFSQSPHLAPNHVILNEYLPGQGIMPHEDGPAYHPVVTTISLGSHAVFHYYQYRPETETEPATNASRSIDPKPVLSVFLEPRSAVITRGSLYTNHLHGIRDIEGDEILIKGSSGHVSLGEFDLPIANWDMTSVRDPGTYRRGARYSLTCRDVAKVFNAKSIVKH